MKHHEKLLFVKFEWGKGFLPSALSLESPPIKFTIDVLIKAISKVKCDEAAGQSDIILEIFRGAGKDSISSITILTN